MSGERLPEISPERARELLAMPEPAPFVVDDDTEAIW